MSQSKIDSLVRKKLFENAQADTIGEILENAAYEDINSIYDILDDLICSKIKAEQLTVAINIIEKWVFDGNKSLIPYVSILYSILGDKVLAHYYVELCEESLLKSEEIRNRIFSLKEEYSELECKNDINATVEKYDINRTYIYNGLEKEYFVSSFTKSETIGKNMTLLKTPYGVVIFDCGAQTLLEGLNRITEEELLKFFKANDVGLEDIVAVIISHAHLDHYGSLATLINLGIPISKVYSGEITRKLISYVSTDIPFVDKIRPIKSFFAPNLSMKITEYINGHILGSQGFVVSFDNINVIYTGDYCVHDQNAVKGLNPNSILNLATIKENGVDCLITETTYGNRNSVLKYKESVRTFNHIVDKAIEYGYKVFIPSFAIGRSQEVAMSLSANHSVMIDGLAIRISEVYEELSDVNVFNSNTRYALAEDEKERNFDVNDIIIASSGMMSKNSTSANYMDELLKSDRKVLVIQTGYISSEAYGDLLLEKWRKAGRAYFKVSLSAHADYKEIYTLIDAINPSSIVTIHGYGLRRN